MAYVGLTAYVQNIEAVITLRLMIYIMVRELWVILSIVEPCYIN
jgi:hypothetical protein